MVVTTTSTAERARRRSMFRNKEAPLLETIVLTGLCSGGVLQQLLVALQPRGSAPSNL